MKQVFHSIPRGSSNTMLHSTGVVNKMRKQTLLTALMGIMIISLGLTVVGADVTVSSGYVKPGDSVDLVFTGTPGANFTVTVTGSRGVMDNVTLVFGNTGQNVWSYHVNETAYTDNIRVRAQIDGETHETGFIVSRMEPGQLAETVRRMAVNSKKQAESALIEAKRKGSLNEAALEMYREAVGLLEESKSYAEEGEHAKAFESIKAALDLFKAVIDETYSTDVPPPTQNEDQRKLIHVRGALQEASRRLQVLTRISQSLERNGFQVEKLNEYIQRMAEGIENAREAIEAGNIGAAERHLSTINEALENTMNTIRQRMEEHNRRKVATYQTSLENRYNTMRNTLTVMQSVDSSKVTGVLTDMTRIDSKLDEARNLYREGKIIDSVRVLNSADRDFKQTFNGLNGDNTKTLLSSLDKLTAQLENELSLRDRLRIQMEIEAAKTRLRTRLEQNSLTSVRPPPKDTSDQNATSLTP